MSRNEHSERCTFAGFAFGDSSSAKFVQKGFGSPWCPDAVYADAVRAIDTASLFERKEGKWLRRFRL